MTTMLTLQDVERARLFYERGWWRSETLYMILRRHALEQPDRFALRDTNRRLTWRAALEWTDAIALSLHDAGLRPGDRVSIWLPSRVETALTLLACSRMGYACNTSLHRDYTCSEVAALIARAGSAAFLGEPGYGADAARHDIFAMLKGATRLMATSRIEPLRAQPATDDPAVLCGLRRGPGQEMPWATSPDRIVYLAFTSGTTGLPKGVMHSDNTLLANGRAIVKDWGFDEDTVVYSLSPLSHNIGIVGLVVALVCGGEFVAHTPLDARRTFDRIVETGATYLLGVPTHAIDLLSEARRRGMMRLGSVNAFQVGGAPVPPATVETMLEFGVRPQNAFGMTENCSFQYTRPGDPPEVVANSCGRTCEGFEISIWREDDRDREAAAGEIGELAGRGACLMLGYFDDQTTTAASFNRHGWFMTGDLARLDASGNLQIAGRKKDLIIRGGHNIYPVRIEDFAMRHALAVKAAAFAVPDARLGEKVCLAVIPRVAIGGDAMLAHLAALGLSKGDMPEFYIELETFPLTPSGKVLKRRLVEMVAAGEITPQPVRWQG